MNRTMLLFLAAALAVSMSVPALATPAAVSEKTRTDFDNFVNQYPGLYQKIDLSDYRNPFERTVVAELMKDQKALDLLPEVDKAVAEMNETYHMQHLLQGVLVSEKQFPDIYKMACENADKLAMPRKFKVYVMNSAEMNAYTWSADLNNYGVALYSGIIKAVSPAELKFVLAHEMGHVKSQHIRTAVLLQLYAKKYNALPDVFGKKKTIFPDDPKAGLADDSSTKKISFERFFTMGDMPKRVAVELANMNARGGELTINATQQHNLGLLDQAKEYSADRAGLVACGNRDDALKGLVKLASGNVGDLGGFDLASYMAQIDQVLSSMDRDKLKGLLGQEGDHAFTLMRVGEMDVYANSSDYQRAAAGRDSDTYGEMLSASFQIGGSLADKSAELKKFNESAEAGEMNALERRLRQKELNDAVVLRSRADTELRPMLLTAVLEPGLGTPNPLFDRLESFIREKKTGQPMLGVLSDLEDKLRGLLTRPDLPANQKPELERKLHVVTELKALKPGASNGGSAPTTSTAAAK